jgi:radical SAM protein with 4Fe4S-binding SPASM domain
MIIFTKYTSCIKGGAVPAGFLKEGCYLKDLEEPYIYDTVSDDLYLLDEETLGRIMTLHSEGTGDTEVITLLGEAGLLQEHPRKLPVWTKGRSADPSLRYLEIQITGRCDKACRHCYLGPPEDRDMDPETFEVILDQFSEIQGLKVMVSGGEPSCHPQFTAMTKNLPSRSLRAILITHGEWIGPGEAALLGERFHQIQVSLDGLEAGHDALRGKGSFEKAAAGIRNLREAGVPVSVGTMVHSQNLDEFDRMSKFIRGLGVEEWSIDVPCAVGRWTETQSDPALLAAMSEKIRHAYGGGFHGGARGLSCGSHLMTVAHDGMAAKCGFYFDDPAGNVREGLAEVWRRIKHIPLERLDCDCDQVEVCAGGCRYRAQTAAGSEQAVDVVQCYARRVK